MAASESPERQSKFELESRHDIETISNGILITKHKCRNALEFDENTSKHNSNNKRRRNRQRYLPTSLRTIAVIETENKNSKQ
jgi:hypothetical protein